MARMGRTVKPTQVIRVALCSGGRESTAMCIRKGLNYWDEFDEQGKQQGIKIFANTGDDPDGLACINKLNELGWNIHIVNSWDKYGKIREYYGGRIVDTNDGFIGHALPSQAAKDCSYKFKIEPITKYLYAKFGENTSFELAFGLSHSLKEIKRSKAVTRNQRKLDTCIFPLIENHIDRELCAGICMQALHFVPKKSICDMCFERNDPDWINFYKDAPERFMSVMEFDRSSKLFKKYGGGASKETAR